MPLRPCRQSATTIGESGSRGSVVYQMRSRTKTRLGRLTWFMTIAVSRQSGAVPSGVRFVMP
jgi:hypothetical protein